MSTGLSGGMSEGGSDVPGVRAQTELHIAMVGKYNGLSDAYLSVIKALQHACLKCKSRLKARVP